MKTGVSHSSFLYNIKPLSIKLRLRLRFSSFTVMQWFAMCCVYVSSKIQKSCDPQLGYYVALFVPPIEKLTQPTGNLKTTELLKRPDEAQR